MPPAPRPSPVDEQEKRKRNLLIITGILVLLVVATVFEVGIRAPQIPFASNLIVFFLFNLNLIVFLLLLVLLFRNLVKLSFERRQKIIGSRFKAKLVLTFLALSLVPGILIFLIASNFITTSIEGWFKPQVEKPLDQAMEVAQTYYQSLETTALRHGRYMGRVIERDGLLAESKREALAGYLTEQQERLGVAAITVFNRDGQELVHVKNPVLADGADPRGQQRARAAGALGPGDHHRPRAGQRRHDPGDGAGARRRPPGARRDRGGHPRAPAPRGAAAQHQPGLPGVQAAPPAQEPDQGHLHPALPADDPDHRLLRHLVRPLPGPRHHRADPDAGRRALEKSRRATSTTR